MDSIRCKSNIHENIERNTFTSKELQIRNSTVDFLVFTRDAGEDGIEVRVQNGDVWLTQKAISQLFDVDRSVITKHLSNIFKEGELDENSVCAKFAQTADDGKTYNYKFYSLAAIIAVGYRINSEPATQFRTWATKVLELIEGNARIPFQELGKSLGMSRVAAKKRVKKLEDTGINRGYNITIYREDEVTVIIDISN